MEILFKPWPWYVSGPLIALVMTLLLLNGKNALECLQTLELFVLFAEQGDKVKFFDFDWKKQQWNLIVIAGVIIGGIYWKHITFK